MSLINDVVNRINSTAQTVSSADVQQRPVTEQIVQRVRQTVSTTASLTSSARESSSNSREIAKAISKVDQKLKQTAHCAARTRQSVQLVAERADEVQLIIKLFQRNAWQGGRLFTADDQMSLAT